MIDQKDSGEDRIEIRKYANRRLYNTATGEFVTLDSLREMVRKGENFKVVDAKSDQDITSSVLAQIIAEQEGRGEHMLPDDILRQIISYYDQGLTENYSDFLRQSMDLFNQNANQMEALGQAGLKNMEMLQKSFAAMFGMPGGAPATKEEATAPSDDESSEEIDALRDELSRMQERLDKLTRK